MQALQYALLFVVAVGATYLMVWRPMDSPQISSGIATLAWVFLIPASGTVTRFSGGQSFSAGSQVMQAFALILAILSALTLIGAVTGHYPTDDQTIDDSNSYE